MPKEVNPMGSVSTGNYKNLMKIDSVSNGNLLYVKSIGEILQQNNLKYVAISSGSTGSAYLLNHKLLVFQLLSSTRFGLLTA